MSVKDQGVTCDKKQRYTVIPRSLILVTSTNPVTLAREVLLLKVGASAEPMLVSLGISLALYSTGSSDEEAVSRVSCLHAACV
jgi:hypothetical protein